MRIFGVLRLILALWMVTIGHARPQFNSFNPLNPFLNIALGFGQNNPNFQQNQQNFPQNSQNFPQNLQNSPQSNFYFPSDPTIANRNPLNQQPNQTIRLNEQKCNEYWEASRTITPVGSLSLYPAIQNIQADSCDTSQGLIIGGENAKVAEFPHMAALGYRNLEATFTFICGGSLISDQYVLTAAHCRRSGRNRPTLVRLGVLNLKVKEANSKEMDVNIASFIAHENYNPNESKNDIAVIRLASKVKLSRFIRPACLMNPTERVHNNKAIATGWGLTNAFYGDNSDVMQKVELSVISNRECQRILDDQNIDGTQLCAGEEKGGKDTCRVRNCQLIEFRKEV